ncbi:hypothetical protein OESDEN_14601, partial [Oesophagostomum dentatum]
IGRVEPPTPGGTREPSTTGEPDRPCVDDDDHDSASERFFKPHSECELYVGDEKPAADIKLSHSDSSIYDRATEDSSCSRSQNPAYSRQRLKEHKKLDTLPNVKRGLLSTGLAGGSLIAEVLLLNARVLGLGEVVALFGVIHVATSRVPNVVRLQNHRIAQCRHIRIVIMGNDPIPVQVDGEPWLQPPGIMQIVHKNRAQLLVRNPAFDATLKKWEEQKERTTAPSTPTSVSAPGMTPGEDVPFIRRASEFVELVESEIAELGVSGVLLQALDTATAAVRAAEQEKKDTGARLSFCVRG